MTPDTSKARKLIEGARELMVANTDNVCSPDSTCTLCRPYHILTQALSLLPDADESASNWQEFDPNREETWPKEAGDYLVTIQGQTRLYVIPKIWYGKNWAFDNPIVLAYQPLPPPYVKP